MSNRELIGKCLWMTSRDFMTLYSWRHNLQSRRIRTETRTRLNYVCAHIEIEHRVKARARSNYNCRRRSILRNHNPTEIWHFFTTKALRSESKTLIDYLCGPFKHTLSYNCVKKASSFCLEPWQRSIWHNPTLKWKSRIIGTVTICWGMSGSLKP